MPKSKASDRLIFRWQTWWSIVGPRLAGKELRLANNIILAPIDDEQFALMKARRAPVLKLQPSSDSSVVRYPPRDEVQSRHRLQIDVEAEDQDAACDAAQKIADRLIVALSLAIPGGRYHTELRMLRQLDNPQESTAWSQSASVTAFSEPEAFEEWDPQKVLALFEASEGDSIADNAFVHLLTAWQLQDTAGSKPLKRSILQHYVLCMEAVVNGAMIKIRKEREDSIRLQERAFASELAETLPKRADKPKAIREASTKLREISMTNMLPSIETVSALWDLPDELRDRAKDLYRFRSSNLSHPGHGEEEGFRKWLRSGPHVAQICLADAVARAFFVSYCEYVARARKA